MVLPLSEHQQRRMATGFETDSEDDFSTVLGFSRDQGRRQHKEIAS